MQGDHHGLIARLRPVKQSLLDSQGRNLSSEHSPNEFVGFSKFMERQSERHGSTPDSQGVNTMIASPSGAFAGVGFAIPSDTVNRIVQLPDKNALGF